MPVAIISFESIAMRGERAVQSLRAWSRDEDGVEILEWVLILAAIVLPLVLLMWTCAYAMVRYYETTSWIVSLPFP